MAVCVIQPDLTRHIHGLDNVHLRADNGERR